MRGERGGKREREREKEREREGGDRESKCKRNILINMAVHYKSKKNTFLVRVGVYRPVKKTFYRNVKQKQ